MTTLFNYDPYYDDFDEDKNFMRVLFRPGYSVQARELTQLQTILSNQIEKFGNHIFKSGSPIVGGKVSLDDRANYIILNPQYLGEDIVLEDWLDKTIISYNSTKTARAKVIAIDYTTTSPILIVKYLSGDRFAESDDMKIYGQNTFATVKSSDAVGRSYVASIQEGVYYFKGQFVKVLPQFLVLEIFYRVGNNSSTVNVYPSYKIGIEFEEIIVDEIDDTSLLDPAQGSFNYQAPGATRYALTTTLSKRTLDSADESSFFEVLRIVNGVKTKEVDYPIYSEIEKTLARRTYEESGNYTVDPFVLSMEEDYADTANNNYVDPDYFAAVLDPGKAYVGGHEVQTIAPTTIGVYRGRATANVFDYDVPTSYSSYVVMEKLKGTTLLDISTFPILDIHCVPSASVDKTQDTKYNSTKIGTLRVNMIKYNGATTADNGTTHTHLVNVFDVNSSSITGTLASSGSTSSNIAIPAAFSTTLTANAYSGMYFRVTDGAGVSLAPILVSESGTNWIKLQSSLPFTPQSNTFSIDSDFKVAKSFVKRNGGSQAWGADVNSESLDTNGYAFITERNRQNLIFEVPFDAIKSNTITNFDFVANKVYSNKVSDSGGTITISTIGTDTFPFAGTPGVLSDSVVLNNIICQVREDTGASNSASGIAGNTILSLANNLFTVTAVDSTTIQVDLNTAGVRADFIIKTKVNNAEDGTNGAIRTKQLYPLNTLTDQHAAVPFNLGGTGALSQANTGTATPITGGYVFSDIGATYFNYEDESGTYQVSKLKTPGSPVSLEVADVYEIVRITDSKTNTGNVTTAMLTSDEHDVTDHYEFDNGQRKSHYDHATIKLKRGYSSPTGSSILVQYKFFKASNAPSPQNKGLFTVDSYTGTNSNLTYTEIPKFVNREDNKIISARAALDFRPTRDVASTDFVGAINPDPDSVAELSFQHYLSRIDQIVVKPSQEIVVLSGKPGVKPTPPTVKPEDMLLYTMYITPYTETVKEVRADFHNNKRFTMKDIGSFENRIKGLEYYVALNTLEKNANDSKVLDGNGLERSKYGIVVDNFTTREVQATYGDAGFDNRCLIEDGRLKPASLMRTFKMRWNESLTTGSYKAIGTGDKKSLMLDYSSTEFARQPYATRYITVAGALYGNFNGNMKLFPEFTSDADTSHTAKVTLNSTQGIEDAFNFVNEGFKFISDQNPSWVNDADNPFAKVVDKRWFETVTTVTNQTVAVSGGAGNLQTTTDKVYISKGAQLNQKQISTSSSEMDVGTFVTDLSINPYLKPRAILFAASGLRPKTQFYSFFDGTSVDNFIVVPTTITMASNTGFSSGELALVANSTNELADAIGYYINDNGPYNLVRISGATGTTVNIINETGKTLNGKWIRGLDSNNERLVSSVDDHRSGLTRAVAASTITLESEAPSVNIAGNTLTLIRSTSSYNGYGREYEIIAYNTTTKVATISGTTTATEQASQWTYSIGVNKSNASGSINGAFYPPAATFRTGERALRLTESFNNSYDTDAISFAEKTFVSSGVTMSKTQLVDTVYNIDVGVKMVGEATSPILTKTTSSSRITSTWSTDPVAQTFFVDPEVYPSGLFVESLNVFFKGKDETLPVTAQIHPTVNGVPSSDYWYPESVTTLQSSDVVITDNPDADDLTTSTQFTFASPVFLKPGLYAVVIKCDTPDYLIWTAEKGKLTTKNQNVSVNPYIGTLYKSQNSMEYVPYLNEDMMFVLNRCEFVTDTANFILQTERQDKKYAIDKFRLIQNAMATQSDTALSLNYSFVSKTYGGSKETVYRDMLPQVTYSFGDDAQYAIGSRRKEMQTQGDFTVKVQMGTTDTKISPVVSLESVYLNAWENFIDNGEINNEDFNIISQGSGYSNSNTVVITSSTGSGALVYVSTDGVHGNVLSMNVQSSGVNYLDDFTISYANTVTTANVTSNANIVLNSEYDSSGGPCLARYITKPITLADGFDAGDLRVFLSANLPSGTALHVFYKVLSSSDTTIFKDRAYQKMECFNPTNVASLTENDFTEFEYRPSLTEDQVRYTTDGGVTYDTFKTFSIKLVMTSSDGSVIPMVKDLRIIALPAG